MDEVTAVRGRRRGGRWVKLSHGLYRPADAVDRAHADLLAWALVLPPSGVFTHLTAAAAYGWWLPPLPADVPVFAAVPRRVTRPRRAGLRISRCDGVEATTVRGVPLATPAETLLACARDLGVVDLVVLVDAALHQASCTEVDLRELAAASRPGASMLRRAIGLADGRSESAWETMLRLLHVVWEVPVEPQYVVETLAGDVVARGDLRVGQTHTLHEYDGENHLDRARQRKDLGRLRALDDAGWVRRGFTSVEVLHQAVGILRDADRTLGLPHRPERVRVWHDLLAASLFTPAGTERARRAWGLSSTAIPSGHVRTL